MTTSRGVGGTGLLVGHRTIITGGGGGIGRAVARRFCEEGARVAVLDIDPDAAEATARLLNADDYEAYAGQLDVTDYAAGEGAFAGAVAQLGGLDSVVATAGIVTVGTLDDLEVREFERTLQVNLLGVFITAKCAAPHLRDSGGGSILCTASIAGLRGGDDMSAYSASKFGVVGLVQCLAAELGPRGIRVAALAPGLTETEMLSTFFARRASIRGETASVVRDTSLESIPLRRVASADEIANGFVFLASPLASYVSGTTVALDGAFLSH